MIGDCTCGCGGACKSATPAVTVGMEFTYEELAILKTTMDAGIAALREKSRRLQAMEPSWTIGPDDLKMLRLATEKQITEADDFIRKMISKNPFEFRRPSSDIN